MDNIVIKNLSIYVDSLMKLYKVIPKDCMKVIQLSESKHDLEVNVNGVLFTGIDDHSNLVLNSSNRD